MGTKTELHRVGMIRTDKENEYFSDGITEDLITALSKVSGLHVAATMRTHRAQVVRLQQLRERR